MERLKDINATRIRPDGDNGIEVYGTDTEGNKVWIWIHDVPREDLEHLTAS
jgi:hypothetical protein